MFRTANSFRNSAVFLILLLTTGLATSSAQTESVVFTFQDPAKGTNPVAGVIKDAAGNFYGTTAVGGANNHGAVFKLDIHGVEIVLYSFRGSPDGDVPAAPLIRDSAGNLYGTTSRGGGPANAGTVFKLDATGKETILHRFTGGADGGNPFASPIRDAAGNLYGTTVSGGDTTISTCLFAGSNGCGVLYKVGPGGKETVLHTFGSGTDGKNPLGPLTADSTGNLYGTTVFGGSSGNGTVFKTNPNGAENILYSFDGGTDGASPSGHLALDAEGNLYGTTQAAGDLNSCLGFGCGTVFKVDPKGNETTLHAFSDLGGADAVSPNQGLIRDTAGNLYGTSTGGGIRGVGTVFKVDADANETLLYGFTGSTDGGAPVCSLLFAPNGTLYGTTEGGGAFATQGGVIFEIKQ